MARWAARRAWTGALGQRLACDLTVGCRLLIGDRPAEGAFGQSGSISAIGSPFFWASKPPFAKSFRFTVSRSALGWMRSTSMPVKAMP
jgi:hypothetical protein